MPKLEQIARVDEKKFGLTEVRVSSVLSLPFLMGLMSIYTYICVCADAPLSIRWDIDGDIHSLFVTLL